VKFLRGDKPSVVIAATGAGRRHKLYDFECQLVQEMNGERDLDELCRVGRKIISGVNRELLEKFILQCAALGLLSNLEVVMPVADNGSPRPPLGEANMDFAAFLREVGGATQYDDLERTAVGGPEAKLLAEAAGGAAEPEAEVPYEPPPEPPPEPEPPAEAPPEPEPPAEPANDEEWRHQKPPWYANPILRRVRGFLLFAVIMVGLAAIPWPLYVTEECVVLPVSRVEVRSVLDGIIAEIRVDEGTRVHKGDLLARIDDRDLKAQLLQARSDIDRLTANLDKMKHGTRKEEIARAEVEVASRAHDLSFTQIEANRRETLFSQGVGSAEQRDNARRDLALKKIALEEAQAQIRLLRAGFRPEEVAVAEAELKRAQTDAEYIEKKLSLLAITSPIDGVVMTPKFRDRLYEKVTAGAAVCEVADTSTVRVEIQVPERHIDVLALGQPTVVKVQSYPLHPFRGKVTFLGTVIEQKEDVRFLRVVTEIENSEGLLREHMTGYGEINTGRSRVLKLLLRRFVRWVRVRFLI
jgi:multidrug resistance efflux pump